MTAKATIAADRFINGRNRHHSMTVELTWKWDYGARNEESKMRCYREYPPSGGWTNQRWWIFEDDKNYGKLAVKR